MLIVFQRNTLADGVVDFCRDGIVLDSEIEYLWRLSGHGHHGKLTFPRLTNETLLRKLLHIACPLARRVAPCEDEPRVENEQEDRKENYPAEAELPA